MQHARRASASSGISGENLRTGGQIRLGVFACPGFAEGTAGKAPDLESRIQILRDGRLVSTQNPGAISQVPWDSRRLVMSGQLTLGPDMVPGDYALQVTVTDKLAARQYSVASQWIDFEIVQ
jgi:hypothetical protein